MDDEFYEDDEAVDKIVAMYEAGIKETTGRVANGRTVYMALPGVGLIPAATNDPSGALVRH